MPEDTLMGEAERLLDACRQRRVKLAAAESLTGGLLSAMLTEIAGASDVVERGFVTYSNAAKIEMLGVPAELIAAQGAVSAPVAAAMASGALEHSRADLAVAVTGLAGPAGGTTTKPIGLVHLAAARRDGATWERELRLGAIGRAKVRLASVAAALALLRTALEA
jgi:nicotinamide-nucleotide amidase